eukprot:scaffold19104_cov74-Phaeocystis_antarctica.AAC.1
MLPELPDEGRAGADLEQARPPGRASRQQASASCDGEKENIAQGCTHAQPTLRSCPQGMTVVPY